MEPVNIHKVLEGLLWYIAFLFSIILHESAHAFTAYKLGDQTAYLGGQVTLDPRPHIRREPVGTVIVPIVSYLLGGWMIGWASIPFDFEWGLRHPKRLGLMSIAGPAANLALALLAALAMRAGLLVGVFVAPDHISFGQVTEAANAGFFEGVATFVSILFSLNLLLFLFNLLPVPPLDGNAILPSFLKEEHARRYLMFMRNPGVAFVGLLLAWNLFGYIFHPIHLECINLLYPDLRYE